MIHSARRGKSRLPGLTTGGAKTITANEPLTIEGELNRWPKLLGRPCVGRLILTRGGRIAIQVRTRTGLDEHDLVLQDPLLAGGSSIMKKEPNPFRSIIKEMVGRLKNSPQAYQEVAPALLSLLESHLKVTQALLQMGACNTAFTNSIIWNHGWRLLRPKDRSLLRAENRLNRECFRLARVRRRLSKASEGLPVSTGLSLSSVYENRRPGTARVLELRTGRKIQICTRHGLEEFELDGPPIRAAGTAYPSALAYLQKRERLAGIEGWQFEIKSEEYNELYREAFLRARRMEGLKLTGEWTRARRDAEAITSGFEFAMKHCVATGDQAEAALCWLKGMEHLADIAVRSKVYELNQLRAKRASGLADYRQVIRQAGLVIEGIREKEPLLREFLSEREIEDSIEAIRTLPFGCRAEIPKQSHVRWYLDVLLDLGRAQQENDRDAERLLTRRTVALWRELSRGPKNGLQADWIRAPSKPE